MDYFRTPRFMDRGVRSTPLSVESKIGITERKLQSRGVTPPPASSRTLLDRFGDVLSIGQYATMGAANKALSDVQRNGLSYNTGKEAFTGFLEGLRAGNPFGEGYQQGEETFGHILDKLGWDVDENKAWYTPDRLAHGAVSLAGDILFDPTTWINPLELGLGAVMKGTGKTLTGQTAKTVAKEAFKKNIDDIGVEAFRKLQQEAGLNASEEAAQALINKVTRDAGYADKVGQGLNVGFGKHRATIIPDSTLRKIGDATIAPYVNTLGEKIGNTKYFKKAAQGAEKIFKSQESLNTRKLSRENPLEAAKKITKLDMYAPTFFKKYHDYMNNYIGRLSESFDGIDNATLNEISDVAEQEGVFKFVKKDVSQTVRNQRTPAMQKFVKDIEEHRDGLEKVINAYMERDANDANIKVLEGYKAKLDNILQSDSGMYDVLSKQSSSNVITDMDTNTLYTLFNDLRHKEVPAIARRLEEIGIPNSEQAAYEVRAMLDRNQQNIPVTELRNFLGDYIDKTASTMDNGRPFYDAFDDYKNSYDNIKDTRSQAEIDYDKQVEYDIASEEDISSVLNDIDATKQNLVNRQQEYFNRTAQKAKDKANKEAMVEKIMSNRMKLLPESFVVIEDGKRILANRSTYAKQIKAQLKDMSFSDLQKLQNEKDLKWFNKEIEVPAELKSDKFSTKTDVKNYWERNSNADKAETRRWNNGKVSEQETMQHILNKRKSLDYAKLTLSQKEDMLDKWLIKENISRVDYDKFVLEADHGKMTRQYTSERLADMLLKQRGLEKGTPEHTDKFLEIVNKMDAMDEAEFKRVSTAIQKREAQLKNMEQSMPVKDDVQPYLELDEKWQDTKDYFENANVKDFSKNVLDSEPEPVHKFNIGGTEIIYGTDTTPDATVDSIGKALRNIGALGNNMRDFLSTLKIHLSDIEGWTEAATDSKGLIIFGKNVNEKADYGRLIEKRVAPHEIGHNFTNQVKNLMFNESGGESRWLEAIRSDMNEVYSKNPVLNRTKDGKEWINYNMMNEDAASSFMLYLSNPVEFAKKFPNRADELQMALKRLKVPQANVKQGLNTKGFVVPRSAERTRTDMIEKLNKRSEDLIDTINTMPLQEAQKQFFEADMLSWNKYVNKDAEDMFKQLYPDDEMFADSIMTITKNFRELDTNSAVYQKFIEKFDPEMQEKITNFMRFMGEEYKRLYDVTSLADKMHVQEIEGYQPHIQAIKPKPSDEPIYNMGNKFDRQRKVDMTIKQYNEWAKETNKNMPLGADGRPVRPYVAELETNAATLLMTYGIYSEQQVWTKKFYTYIVDTFGTKYDDLLTIPAGKDVYASTEDILEILRNPTLVNNTETMQKMGIPQDIIDAVSAKGDARRIPKSITKINKETFAELKNLSDNFYAFGMEDAVADSLNNMGMVQLNKTKNSFLKMYDTALRTWKVYNTSMNPGFHVRNAISNQFQSFLNVGSDALNPDTQFKAIKMLGKDEAYLNNTRIDVQGKSYSLKQVLEYATSLGVVNGGQFKEAVTELGTPANPLQKMFNKTSGKKVLKGQFDKQSINPLNVDKFVPAKIGGEIGNKVEAQSRLANFLANLKQGKDFYESADNVTKYFFDYNDLSETERQVFKRLVPFYTWMRKNLPLQLEGMLTKPNVYRAYFKTKRAVENMIPEEQKIDNKDKNRFAQDWFQLPTSSEGENGAEPNFYNPNLPLGELNNIPRPTLDYAKQLMGMATPFVKLPMEMIMNKNLFFDSPISRGIGDTADAPGYIQRLTGGTKENPTQMNPYMRYVLRNIGALENISKITMPSNSSDDTLQALIKTIAGQNLYSYDVNTFKKWANRDRLKMLQDLLNKEEEKRKAN